MAKKLYLKDSKVFISQASLAMIVIIKQCHWPVTLCLEKIIVDHNLGNPVPQPLISHFYLPAYNSTFFHQSLSKKSPLTYTRVKNWFAQISIIIIWYSNKHPLLHGTSNNVFSWLTWAVQVKMLWELSFSVKLNVVDTHQHNCGIKK